VYVEDLGSRNGTLLNGEPLTHAAQLRRGDQVQFGQTVAEAVR
jgi:pSer/pThr/pTyr-binding forkhead associated (FHA) protein